jgi:FtsH-binding integral membrane protein
MNELRAQQAAEALGAIRQHQQQVIDQASVPGWYWWAVGGLMVVLAAGVDSRSAAVLGGAVAVFVVGMLASTGVVIRGQVLRAKLRPEMLSGRSVLLILLIAAAVVGGTLGLAFGLRSADVTYPATLACLVGGTALGLAGPVLMRTLRRGMLDSRAGTT